MLQKFILTRLVDEAIKVILENVDQLKPMVHQWLAESDIPMLPENLEGPLDDFLEAAFAEAVEKLKTALMALKETI